MGTGRQTLSSTTRRGAIGKGQPHLAPARLSQIKEGIRPPAYSTKIVVIGRREMLGLSQNTCLGSLSSSALDLLQPHLTRLVIKRETVLWSVGEAASQVFFFQSQD
jgi:hypothetical protein